MSDKQVFRLDPEHAPLRLAVLLCFFGAAALGYVVLTALIPSSGINVIALLGALFIGYVVTNLAERLLKGRWHSGRAVEIAPDGTIRLTKNGALESEMHPNRETNVLMWRFEISKRAQVPKGWSMVACALEHDGQYLALYTFMPPDHVATFDPKSEFRLLKGKKERPQTSSPVNPLRDAPDLRLAGEERRLNEAETARWLGGGEMGRDNFESVVAWVRQHYAEWITV
jgi:hypothetical protein